MQGQGALALTLVCSHPAGLLRLRQAEELPMRKTDVRGSLVYTRCDPSAPGTPNPGIGITFQAPGRESPSLGVLHHRAARAAMSRENGDRPVRGTAGSAHPQHCPTSGNAPSPGPPHPKSPGAAENASPGDPLSILTPPPSHPPHSPQTDTRGHRKGQVHVFFYKDPHEGELN